MTWQLAIGLASGSVISVNFLEVPIAEADVRFGAQSGLKSDYRVLLVFSYVSALGHSRRRRSRRSSADVRTAPRTDPTPGLWASQQTRVTGYACAAARRISTCTVA